MFNLNKYQDFRSEAITLRDGLTIALEKMDATMIDDTISDPLRAQRMQTILDTYVIV